MNGSLGLVGSILYSRLEDDSEREGSKFDGCGGWRQLVWLLFILSLHKLGQATTIHGNPVGFACR